MGAGDFTRPMVAQLHAMRSNTRSTCVAVHWLPPRGVGMAFAVSALARPCWLTTPAARSSPMISAMSAALALARAFMASVASSRVFSVGRPPRRMSGCLLRPLGDLCDGRSAASRGGLYTAPGLLGFDHLSDAGVALYVLRTAFVEAVCFRFGLALRLSASPVVVILSGNGGEHIEQHAVDRFEHAGGELVGGLRCHQPRCR